MNKEQHTDTVSNFKQTIENLDINAPKIDVINWDIFDAILTEYDFTKCKNTLDAMKAFYEYTWAHMIFPREEEAHLLNREIGRLILEADTWRRKFEALEQAQEAEKRTYL